jgi:hypothetical protein
MKRTPPPRTVTFGEPQVATINNINARLANRAMNNITGKMAGLKLANKNTRVNNLANKLGKMTLNNGKKSGGRRRKTLRKHRRRTGRKN